MEVFWLSSTNRCEATTHSKRRETAMTQTRSAALRTVPGSRVYALAATPMLIIAAPSLTARGCSRLKASKLRARPTATAKMTALGHSPSQSKPVAGRIGPVGTRTIPAPAGRGPAADLQCARACALDINPSYLQPHIDCRPHTFATTGQLPGPGKWSRFFVESRQTAFCIGLNMGCSLTQRALLRLQSEILTLEESTQTDGFPMAISVEGQICYSIVPLRSSLTPETRLSQRALAIDLDPWDASFSKYQSLYTSDLKQHLLLAYEPNKFEMRQIFIIFMLDL
ncbi:hypothetical protein O181_019609 [Austropuccinia psidii MF-1]|uniref:Uncharacterized protein n=1 Tax=Austropuccinia psidii MF-1 TaxID=1389203 RepID=A0A9Q3C7E9_9BASI|nr:hypothetical protein [Austropuccinia psidii MF-1]